MKLLFRLENRTKQSSHPLSCYINVEDTSKKSGRAQITFPVGISIPKGKWNINAGQVRGNSHKTRVINLRIENLKKMFSEELLNYHKKGLRPDKSMLVRVVNKSQGIDIDQKPNVNVRDYLADFLDGIDGRIIKSGKKSKPYAENTKKTYRSFVKLFNEWEDLRSKKGFSYLTLKYTTQQDLKSFTDYLKKERYRQSTIDKRVKVFKAIIGKAEKEDIEVSSAFKRFEAGATDRDENEEIIYLTEDDISKIQSVKDLPNYLENTRRIVYLHLEVGQRVGDMMAITEENIIRNGEQVTFTIINEKTGKEVRIPILNKFALEVVNTGLFKTMKPQVYNRFLKELGKRAALNNEIEGSLKVKGRNIKVKAEKFQFLTSHVLRRTCLTRLYQEGIPEYYIMLISRHAKSETLHQYIGRNPDIEREEQLLREFLENAEKKKAPLKGNKS